MGRTSSKKATVWLLHLVEKQALKMTKYLVWMENRCPVIPLGTSMRQATKKEHGRRIPRRRIPRSHQYQASSKMDLESAQTWHRTKRKSKSQLQCSVSRHWMAFGKNQRVLKLTSKA